MDIEVRDFKSFKIIDGITIGDITTYDEAYSLKMEIHESVIWIEDQIQNAGPSSDQDWLKRAKTALRFRKFSLQRLQEHCSDLRKSEKIKRYRTRDEYLIEKLRAIVGEDMFHKCVAVVEAEIQSKQMVGE